MLQDHIWKHTAPEAHSKHAPGAVCISNMVLEHIWLRKFFQIINGPGACGPDHKLRSKSPKKALLHRKSTKLPIIWDNLHLWTCSKKLSKLFCYSNLFSNVFFLLLLLLLFSFCTTYLILKMHLITHVVLKQNYKIFWKFKFALM